MVAISTPPELLDKENVANLKFPSDDVLASADEIKQRRANLERALTLGNLEHHKMKIIFQDDGSVKAIETTIWGVTDKRVILKHGMVIPIHRIYEIR